MDTYRLVGNILTIKGVRYQRVSYWNDVYLAAGWVQLDNWKNGKQPFYIFSNRELKLDYMGRNVRCV